MAEIELSTNGQLHQETQIDLEALDHYKRHGLIPPFLTIVSEDKQYKHELVRRVQFIKHAQNLGFSLTEIAELLSLREVSETACVDIKKQAEAKIIDIDAKIRNLEKIKQVLTCLTSACAGTGKISECPVLEALDLEGL